MLLFVVPLALVASTTLVLAQDGPALDPADRAGMEQCLQSAAGRGARTDECIGFVQDPCGETPDGQSTAGSVACIAREHASGTGCSTILCALARDWHG